MKRIFTSIVLLCACLFASAQNQNGDVNGDGKVDVTDVTYLVNLILQKNNSTQAQLEKAIQELQSRIEDIEKGENPIVSTRLSNVEKFIYEHTDGSGNIILFADAQNIATSYDVNYVPTGYTYKTSVLCGKAHISETGYIYGAKTDITIDNCDYVGKNISSATVPVGKYLRFFAKCKDTSKYIYSTIIAVK